MIPNLKNPKLDEFEDVEDFDGEEPRGGPGDDDSDDDPFDDQPTRRRPLAPRA